MLGLGVIPLIQADPKRIQVDPRTPEAKDVRAWVWHEYFVLL